MTEWDDADGDSGPEPFDLDVEDDVLAAVLPCPACGAAMHEDSPRCPACGHWLTRAERTSPRTSRKWYVRFGLWAALAIALSMVSIAVVRLWAAIAEWSR